MMLRDLYLALGGVLAQDGIPLHFGDQAAELAAARAQAVIFDRSHEGRFHLTGRDRLTIMHRMSTNDLLALASDWAAATLFTNPNGRILDRAVVVHRGEQALVLTEPGRSDALQQYLQRNIFFNDDARLLPLAASTHAFALHGPNADGVLAALAPASSGLGRDQATTVTIAETDVYVVKVKPVSGSAWIVIVPSEAASAVFRAFTAVGVRPAGSLTYNTLRIAAGRPGVGRELSTDYLPLEVGLWDEVSFTKGCYTGQEILARMESRGKLAKTIVQLRLAHMVDAPAPLTLDGRSVGMLTSSVRGADGRVYALGVVKLASAVVGQMLTVGNGIEASINALAGVQPAQLQPEDGNEA